MNPQQRLEEINFWQEILGRYSGILGIMYERKLISLDYITKELQYIMNCLINLKGSDDEDVLVVSQLIQELNK